MWCTRHTQGTAPRRAVREVAALPPPPLHLLQDVNTTPLLVVLLQDVLVDPKFLDEHL